MESVAPGGGNRVARPVDQGALDRRDGARVPDAMAQLDGAEAARSGGAERPVRSRSDESQSVRGMFSGAEAGLERRTLFLQGRILGIPVSVRGRHSLEGG